MFTRILLASKFRITARSLTSVSKAQMPELAKLRHKVKRGNYAVLNDKDIAFFETILGQANILTDHRNDDLERYNIDFLRSIRGESKLVLKPNTTEMISEILKYCNQRRLALCPQGGNTGLVGGSVPICDEIVLSIEHLNKILSIDEITGIVTCEAGCILETLNSKANEKGLVVPIDLGAKSSCQIGGNVSTNAGGLRVLRYGNLHGSVLGVEVVLANGDILDLMSDFKKDNTGYHMKHLFIGSEGTLGIVTKVAMLCPPISKAVHVAFLGINSIENVLQTFKSAKEYLGEILSACELIDNKSLDASISHFNLNPPIFGYPFYMLLETSGSSNDHDLEKFNRFLEYVLNEGIVMDGTITDEVTKMQNIWKLRELLPIALVKDGYCFKYDISLPLRKFYNIVDMMEERVGTISKRVCGYGHLGDSNLHLNISCESYSSKLYELIEPFVYQYTAEVKGSISAEHGIGFLKKNYLEYSKQAKAINMMYQLKKLMDPNGILNPYKVLK